MTRTPLISIAVALALAGSASAGELVLDGRSIQGGLMVGETRPPARVTLNGKAIRVSRSGTFVVGFARKASSKAVLKAVFPDGSAEVRRLTVEQRKYRIQRIDGLPRRMVTPSKEALKRIRAEGRQIRIARAKYTEAQWFRQGFVWPVIGRVTGVYGSQRILNGKPRRPHFGIDIAAPTGTPVRAAAGGVVSLAEPDLYFTGGTLIIDHGLGLSSVYSHLSKVKVKEGERVERGAIVASVGSTGRSTGPHLDWRINLYQERLDPQLLVGPMPKPAE